MYIYCVTNYKTVALYLIIIKETLDLIKLSLHICYLIIVMKTKNLPESY